MKEIPTAEEFLKGCEHDGSFIPVSEVKRLMIDFAKLHVEAALKAAYENADLKEEEAGDEQICWNESQMGDCYVLDKNSILSAYPLTNIK